MKETIKKHAANGRVALQLSGGKDSLACLYLMKPHWPLLTVYWLNTGAAFPETIALMERIKKLVPNFVEIAGCQPQVIERFGIPSDIVPVSGTEMGVMAAGGGVLIQDAYSCCARSLMLPMHQKMIEDGVTLIIRGQKNNDKLKGPARSGDVLEGMELLYPIEEWTDEEVFDYLGVQGRELPAFYKELKSSPDCVTCSAYWEEGRAGYLKRFHPEYHVIYMDRMNVISSAIAKHTRAFNEEIEQ